MTLAELLDRNHVIAGTRFRDPHTGEVWTAEELLGQAEAFAGQLEAFDVYARPQGGRVAIGLRRRADGRDLGVVLVEEQAKTVSSDSSI